jgi:hypothetical protein
MRSCEAALDVMVVRYPSSIIDDWGMLCQVYSAGHVLLLHLLCIWVKL